MNKVVIVGGSGYFGKFLTPNLSKVFEIDNYDISNGDDLFDEEKLISRLKDAYAVIHLAAHPHFLPSIPEKEFQRLNVGGTKAVFNAAKKAGIKVFIYTSSGATYGYDAGFITPPSFPVPLSHHGDHEGVNAYARSKIDAERFLESAEKEGMNVVACRVNWPQGNIPPNLRAKHLYDYTSESFLSEIYIKIINTILPSDYLVFNTTYAQIPNFDAEEFIKTHYPNVPSTVKGSDSLVDISNRLEILKI